MKGRNNIQSAYNTRLLIKSTEKFNFMRLTLCPKEISHGTERRERGGGRKQQNNNRKYPWDERYLNWLRATSAKRLGKRHSKNKKRNRKKSRRKLSSHPL